MRGRFLMGCCVAGAAFACGNPKAGDACREDQCVGNQWFKCETGVFQPVNCPGPLGCSLKGSVGSLIILCDLSGTKAGDFCTQGMTGETLCESTGNAALVCTNQQFTQTSCPTSCVTSQPDGSGGVCN
jgi:hypothetical protein